MRRAPVRFAVLALLAASCRAPDASAPDVPVVLAANGDVVVEGTRYRLEEAGDVERLGAWLAAWRADPERELLEMRSAPGTPTASVIALFDLLEAHGVDDYRLRKGAPLR